MSLAAQLVAEARDRDARRAAGLSPRRTFTPRKRAGEYADAERRRGYLSEYHAGYVHPDPDGRRRYKTEWARAKRGSSQASPVTPMGSEADVCRLLALVAAAIQV